MADAMLLHSMIVSSDGGAHCRYAGGPYGMDPEAGEELRARRIVVLGGDERVEQAEWDTMGTTPYSFPGPNDGCGTGSRRRFLLAFDHDACRITVRVRLKLEPDDGVEVTADKKRAWKTRIENSWSDWVFLDRQSGPAPCDHYTLLVEIVWVAEDEERDYRVRVSAGEARAAMTRWYLDDPDLVAAHEFGHMLGNVDEYYDERCPNRPVRDGIMNDQEEWPLPFPRHYTAVRQWVEYFLCSSFEVKEKWNVHGGGW
ncbi:MAG: hypothetical protein HYY06_05140 [Deltaproteobacteria bacterium]|nr:hypothetical protein [Deltaproteobacteria bacterium]